MIIYICVRVSIIGKVFNPIEYTLPWTEFELTTFVVIGTDYTK